LGYFYERIRKSDDGQTITFKSGVKLAFEDARTALITCGTLASAEAIAATATLVPMQVNLIASTVAVDTTLGAAYFKTAVSADVLGQLATVMVRTPVAYNVFDAYGLQSHMTFTNDMETTDANAHLTAISGKITFTGTPTIAKGWLTAGLFIIEGTGTVTQMCHGVSIVEESGSTGAQSMLHLNTDVGTTPYFSFAGADGTGKSIYTHTAAGTQLGTIKILVNGAAKWLPFMQAE
jgi:hypothetical protein